MTTFTDLVPIPVAQAYAEFRAAFAALPPGTLPTDVNDWYDLRDAIRETRNCRESQQVAYNIDIK
jgi:hypothetical protein